MNDAHPFSFANRADRARRGHPVLLDTPAHRARQYERSSADRVIRSAYVRQGLTRTAQHKRIAAILESGKTDGIWARSTGEYSRACRALDKLVVQVDRYNRRTI